MDEEAVAPAALQKTAMLAVIWYLDVKVLWSSIKMMRIYIFQLHHWLIRWNDLKPKQELTASNIQTQSST